MSIYKRIKFEQLRYSFLSILRKHAVGYQVFLFILGVVGGVTGVLPDLFPEIANMPFRNLDNAFARLAVFDRKSREIPLAVIDIDLAGHQDLYAAIASLEPVILPPYKTLRQRSLGSMRGVIFSKNFVAFGGLALSPIVGVVIGDDQINDAKNICFRNDVAFAVDGKKRRFWSRLGITITLLALVLSSGASILQENGKITSSSPNA